MPTFKQNMAMVEKWTGHYTQIVCNLSDCTRTRREVGVPNEKRSATAMCSACKWCMHSASGYSPYPPPSTGL